jgi:hypothetical protein
LGNALIERGIRARALSIVRATGALAGRSNDFRTAAAFSRRLLRHQTQEFRVLTVPRQRKRASLVHKTDDRLATSLVPVTPRTGSTPRFRNLCCPHPRSLHRLSSDLCGAAGDRCRRNRLTVDQSSLYPIRDVGGARGRRRPIESPDCRDLCSKMRLEIRRRDAAANFRGGHRLRFPENPGPRNTLTTEKGNGTAPFVPHLAPRAQALGKRIEIDVQHLENERISPQTQRIHRCSGRLFR